MRFAGFLALSALMACDGKPAREKFPGPPGRTTEVAQADAQRAVMGGVNGQGAPVESHAGPGDGAQPAAAGQRIAGRLELPQGAQPKGSFLFIAVRTPEGGPPLAVRRDQNPTFPYEFSLSSADAMMAGTPFEGDVIVTARLKQDSDPLSRKPGDYSGTFQTRVGDTSVRIVLKAD